MIEIFITSQKYVIRNLELNDVICRNVMRWKYSSGGNSTLFFDRKLAFIQHYRHSVSPIPPFYLPQWPPPPRSLKLFTLLFRQRRRDRPPPLHVLPHVLRLRKPRLRPADPAQDAKLEAKIQILPLVRKRKEERDDKLFITFDLA